MGTVAFEGFVVFCADVAASARFYEGALGLRRESAADDIEAADINLHLPTKGDPEGASLLLHRRHDGMPAPHQLGTFAVDDVDGVVEQLRSAGYRISAEPTDEPWGVREAGVLDPDGYGLTLSGPPLSGPPSDS
jgi:catechol 2,3-dioxygenase-like lactoylglutathione lyase family enzyme